MGMEILFLTLTYKLLITAENTAVFYRGNFNEKGPEKNMFLLMTDTDPDELGEALTRVEDSRTKNGGAGGTHALATGAKPRGGGQGHGGGARRDRGGRGKARGRRDGKGNQHHHHQQQWASHLIVQQQQQWASKLPRNSSRDP